MIVSLLDHIHERKIARLSDACSRAIRSGDAVEARDAWDELKAAVESRSPDQIERLERSRGLD